MISIFCRMIGRNSNARLVICRVWRRKIALYMSNWIRCVSSKCWVKRPCKSNTTNSNSWSYKESSGKPKSVHFNKKSHTLTTTPVNTRTKAKPANKRRSGIVRRYWRGSRILMWCGSRIRSMASRGASWRRGRGRGSSWGIRSTKWKKWPS